MNHLQNHETRGTHNAKVNLPQSKLGRKAVGDALGMVGAVHELATEAAEACKSKRQQRILPLAAW